MCPNTKCSRVYSTAIHSRALRISRMQKMDGIATMAVKDCMNLGSIVSKNIVGNLARNVAIVSSYSSLLFKPFSGSDFRWLGV